MFKKALAIAVLVGSSIFLVSTGAQAATPSPYPSTGAVSVTVAGTPDMIAPGQPQTLGFGGYGPGEMTTASADSADLNLASVKVAVSATKAADDAGQVEYIASSDVPGTYTIRVVGQDGNTATAQFVVTPVDADGKFITAAPDSTTSSSPLLMIWIIVGVGILILALIITLVTVRRKRALV